MIIYCLVEDVFQWLVHVLESIVSLPSGKRIGERLSQIDPWRKAELSFTYCRISIQNIWSILNLFVLLGF